jgi:hypothetical protein
MSNEKILDSLLERNNNLKLKLIKEQFKNNNFPSVYSEKYLLEVLSEYKKHKSIFKAASNVNIDQNIVMDCYIQGLNGNPKFRGFSLAINEINNDNEVNINDENSKAIKNNEINVEGCKISQYGDGWSYTTYVDGEKIFIISNELDDLKKKVKDQNLPLD